MLMAIMRGNESPTQALANSPPVPPRLGDLDALAVFLLGLWLGVQCEAERRLKLEMILPPDAGIPDLWMLRVAAR